MKILVLEDNKFRIKLFKEIFIRHELFFTDNVSQAKELLDTFQFDEIYLDHDLDDRIFVDSNEENTGFQLAKYIGENDNINPKKTKIIVHSMNPIGSLKMIRHLDSLGYKCDYLPFQIFLDYYKENNR